jgi:hypothetical protein
MDFTWISLFKIREVCHVILTRLMLHANRVQQELKRMKLLLLNPTPKSLIQGVSCNFWLPLFTTTGDVLYNKAQVRGLFCCSVQSVYKRLDILGTP